MWNIIILNYGKHIYKYKSIATEKTRRDREGNVDCIKVFMKGKCKKKKTHLWHLNLTSGRNEGAAADRVKEYKSGFIWYQNANTF